MPTFSLKRYLPHILAVVIFLVIALVYCKPALEGKVLQQHDITHWKGAIHQSEIFKEKHGEMPLWTNSVFSGMPAFQIGTSSNNVIPGYVHKVLTLGLPAPIQFFFLASICFYFLCLVLRVNPYVGILAALGFAYATYNAVIISVGHDTKMWSIAYMPALLGAVLLIYQRKYWIGAALTGIFTATMLAMNHPQIDYYFFIAAAIMTVFYIAHWIREKDWKHMGLALALTGVSALAGVASNAVNLMSTYEFQKETIRGGGSELTDSTKANKNTGNGLDKDYAFDYSMEKPEPLVMLLPRMYGGSNTSSYPEAVGGQGYREMDEANSKALEALQNMPQQLAQQMGGSLALYWGGIGVTSGPPYAGAIICFLAILSLFVVKGENKWWAWVAILLSIMMSWGGFFRPLNDLLFDTLPFYNKFRAPSMILVIPQLLLSFLAALGLNAFISASDKKALWAPFKKGLMATGALFIVIFFLYFTLPFMSEQDNALLKQARSMNQPQISEPVKKFFDALKEDRKSLMMGDILRSLAFIGATALLIFLVIKEKIKPLLATGLIGFFVLVDLLGIDSKYLNSANYEDQSETAPAFVKTPLDEQILQDRGFFRVFNLAGGEAFNENITSYHFNSAGGYTAVKLRIYQDLIEKRLFPEQSMLVQALQRNADSIPFVNTPTLDMLNVKYFIYKENQETKGKWTNVHALGNCWFVDSIRFTKDANETMQAIGNIKPASVALVMENAKGDIPFPAAHDSTASITLVKNENDHISYASNASTNQFAVFSEIFYKSGWKAKIDGKPATIVRTNYVLRGLAIPSGKHDITFDFEPDGYLKGKNITSFASIFLLLLLGSGIFLQWKKDKNGKAAVA